MSVLPFLPSSSALLAVLLFVSKQACCLQVLPTQLIPDEKEGKVLRVRLIQKEGIKLFNPSFLFDEGSTISWIPCGRKLTCSFPGIKFFYGPDTYYGEEVSLQLEKYSMLVDQCKCTLLVQSTSKALIAY